MGFIVKFFSDLWIRKYLLKELVFRELRLRYSRPFLGFLWAFITPFLYSLIFYFVFSTFLKVKIENIPFFLYLISALFGWVFFIDSILTSCTSIVQNKNLIRETNFPHYLIPLSICLGGFINFLPSLLVVMILCIYFLKGLSVSILLLPFVLLLLLTTSFGISLIVAILYVRWRDLRYALELFFTFLFYFTPIVYPLQIALENLPQKFFVFYLNNPLVGIVNLLRVCLLKGYYHSIKNHLNLFSLLVMPVIFAFLSLGTGLYLYLKKRTQINDYLSY